MVWGCEPGCRPGPAAAGVGCTLCQRWWVWRRWHGFVGGATRSSPASCRAASVPYPRPARHQPLPAILVPVVWPTGKRRWADGIIHSKPPAMVLTRFPGSCTGRCSAKPELRVTRYTDPAIIWKLLQGNDIPNLISRLAASPWKTTVRSIRWPAMVLPVADSQTGAWMSG